MGGKWKKGKEREGGKGREVLEQRMGEREGKDEARQKTAVKKSGGKKKCKKSSRWRK